jgi:hypothetical protein
MTAIPRTSQPERIAAGTDRWLPALEQALKSRVGWVDEAVSPFAGGRRPAHTPGKIAREPIPGKAA